MVFAPVGIRCPDHSGQAQGARKVVQRVQRRTSRKPGIVTTTLIAINVGVYLLQLAGGATVDSNSGWIYEHGALFIEAIDSNGQIVGLAQGEWWRLLTSTFLHGGPIHLGLNMLTLWWIGRPLEDWLGPVRYLLLYLVAGLAGSAGALLLSPGAITVGASGAIFGIIGAALVLERQQTYVLGGSAITLLVLGLALTFYRPGISIGGHLGGLAGGALAILALSQFGRRSAIYSRFDIASIASLLAVGLLSVAVAYWKVRGYA
jgi:membrane associated rhomboid family serine protease